MSDPRRITLKQWIEGDLRQRSAWLKEDVTLSPEDDEELRRMNLVDSVPAYWHQRGLSMRAANALANGNIRNIEQLKTVTRADLLLLPNFGRVSLREVQTVTGWPKDQIARKAK